MAQDLLKILKSLNLNADWVGLREVINNKRSHFIRNGLPESNSSTTDHGVMVEVLVNGQFGYGATSNISVEGVQLAAENALKMATKSSQFKLHSFNLKHRPKVVGEYVSPSSDIQMGAADINDFLCLTSDEIKKHRGIEISSASVMLVNSEVNFVSSNGSDFRSKFNLAGYELSATAVEAGQSQTRTWSGMGQMGLEFLDRDIFFQNAHRISNEALELISAQECPEGVFDLLIDPDQMVLQVHESIGHPLELDRILGDERNYAGWSFVTPNDFGKLKYGPEILNVTFDPTVSGELASYKIDDGAQEAQREFIIKNGILQRGLGGLESQDRLGLPGVANFRSCNWNRAPIDRMANINLEPGTNSLNDMISSVERGVYMQSNRSWSIDDYRNKFQFGCEYARLIEDGKLTKVVKNPGYRGITIPFWNNLKMVGNKDTYEVKGSFYCGKGEPNQVIQVGHAVPACLFSNIEVFGGA